MTFTFSPIYLCEISQWCLQDLTFHPIRTQVISFEKEPHGNKSSERGWFYLDFCGTFSDPRYPWFGSIRSSGPFFCAHGWHLYKENAVVGQSNSSFILSDQWAFCQDMRRRHFRHSSCSAFISQQWKSGWQIDPTEKIFLAENVSCQLTVPQKAGWFHTSSISLCRGFHKPRAKSWLRQDQWLQKKPAGKRLGLNVTLESRTYTGYLFSELRSPSMSELASNNAFAL